MDRPKTETPCKNCGHPYVRHTKRQSAWDENRFGCRECDCTKFTTLADKLKPLTEGPT